MDYQATYSPDDNKLRLYAGGRLPADVYQRVKAAGFKWAPKQELFVAPMWTPGREDLLLELCGEIDDEDTTLTQRAEERAERFEDYSEKRGKEADQAHKVVSGIADNIPLGQPILVGHHSEKRARKDAERIQNGMRKAVQLWKTSEYWKDRAAGAVRHAKYKERPDVRARRIKKIEADKRKQERTKADAAKFLKLYDDPEGLEAKLRDGRPLIQTLLGTYEGGLPWDDIPKYERGEIPFAQAFEVAKQNKRQIVAWCERWIEHYDNRLAYERAMLADAGGTIADKTGPEVGGGCRCWASPRGGWSYIKKVNRVSVTVLDNWGNGGRNFTRVIPFDKLAGIMTKAQVEAKREAGLLTDAQDGLGFYLHDQPQTPRPEQKAPDERYTKLQEQLKAGVKVVTAAQLFPTPPDLARRMVDLAQIEPDHRVLEPSAGTGRLLDAIGDGPDKVAVEVNPSLVDILSCGAPSGTKVQQGDFLALNGELGTFDRIVMNPPFVKGEDIKHIEHALTLLKPGGRLVALCANGPRQQERLRCLANEWYDLPADSFKDEGTRVNVALLVFDK